MTSIREGEFRMLPSDLIDYRPRHAIQDDQSVAAVLHVGAWNDEDGYGELTERVKYCRETTPKLSQVASDE
jgi:hypothetical protein